MFWGEIGGLVTRHPIIGSVDRRRSGVRARALFLGSVQRSITCDSHVNSGPRCFTHCHLLFQVMSNDHVAPLFGLLPFFNHSCSTLSFSHSFFLTTHFQMQNFFNKNTHYIAKATSTARGITFSTTITIEDVFE